MLVLSKVLWISLSVFYEEVISLHSRHSTVCFFVPCRAGPASCKRNRAPHVVMGETGKWDARAHRSLIPCLVLRGAENTRGLRGERNSIQVDKYKPKEHLLCMPGSKGRTIRKVIGGGGVPELLDFFSL